MSDIDHDLSNDTTQAAIERLRTPIHRTAAPAPMSAPTQAAARPLLVTAEVGSAAAKGVNAEQLRKTREGIAGHINSIDAATNSMNLLWAQIQREREELADMRRGEAILEAALLEGNRPRFAQ